MRHVYGWLLLMPAAILLVAFTHYPTVATPHVDSLFSKGTCDPALASSSAPATTRPCWRTRSSGRSSINNLWFALGTIPASIALASPWRCWSTARCPGACAAAHGLLHADDPADDRRGQHLAVLLHAGHRPAWTSSSAPCSVFGGRTTGSAIRIPCCPAIIVMTIWKEAGFFMIFYLAALQHLLAGAGRGGAHRRRYRRWYYFRRVLVSAADAHHVVRADQRGAEQRSSWSTTCSCSPRAVPDNASNLLLYYIFETAFSYFDANYAATLTVVLLGILAYAGAQASSSF